jgi:hypothetical protein
MLTGEQHYDRDRRKARRVKGLPEVSRFMPSREPDSTLDGARRKQT